MRKIAWCIQAQAEGETLFRLHDDGQREAFVAAMSAEVVRRLLRPSAA